MNEKLKVYDDKMTKTMANLDGELGTIRAGRANPNVLNRIKVDYYGTPSPIQQVAYDPDSAVGEEYAEGDREGDPGIGSRDTSDERRDDDPPDIPGAYRGAQKRAGEGC